MKEIKLKSHWPPKGDQPQAIEKITNLLKKGERFVTLLGATGTGKTFTIANVIENLQKPTLIIAHNKTLAAQLAAEFKEFFPNNAVHFFVSYYDYYQPEAYKPVTDTYIEKEATINKEIDRLRHAATQSLLTRDDVIVISSVSAIYGVGNPLPYIKAAKHIKVKDKLNRTELARLLISLFYERNDLELVPGFFRVIGNSIEIYPASEEVLYKISFLGSQIFKIDKINPITREFIEELEELIIFPAKHFVSEKDIQEKAIKIIEKDLEERIKDLESQNKKTEAERLYRRVKHDLARIKEFGYCNGIENYSRYFDGRMPGEPPNTLIDFFKYNPSSGKFDRDFLTVIDESHQTIPQIGGMYEGDKSRKKTLVEYGFRLPAALDNRPLTLEEFFNSIYQAIFVSATPGNFEKQNSKIVEQIIRPTGLLDPEIFVRKLTGTKQNKGQIQDAIDEIKKTIKTGGRILVTTLTKKMAEDLSDFLQKEKIKSNYIHSDIKTQDRVKILSDFRKGVFDVLVGVNLLREGLDLPEVELVLILDADKEGFLRSETSLIQTIGRAARNVNGRVILYADKVTNSMKQAINETNRRRKIQMEYNKKHNITPQSIKKEIKDILEEFQTTKHKKAVRLLADIDIKALDKGNDLKKLIKDKKIDMENAAKNLDFETAALIRDEIKELEKILKKTVK